jgi:hypothetical protein
MTEPLGISISPDGRNVYVLARGPYDRPGRLDDGSIAAFTILEDGSIEQLPGTAGCVTAGGRGEGTQENVCTAIPLGPDTDLEITADGRNAYAAAYPSGILSFERDPETGALTPMAGLDACITPDGSAGTDGQARCMTEPRLPGAAPEWRSSNDVLASADGRTVYVVGDDGSEAAIVASDRNESGRLAFRSCVDETGEEGCAVGRFVGGARSGAISPDGHVLVTAAGGMSIFDLDADGDPVQRSGVDGCVSADGAAGDGSGCQEAPVAGVHLEFGSNELLNVIGDAGIATFGPPLPEPEIEEPPVQLPAPLATAPAARPPILRLSPRMSASWTVAGRVTTARSLSVEGLGAGAGVEVRCRASICPFRSRAATSALGEPVDVLGLVSPHFSLRAGQMIEIRVTAPGTPGRAFRYRARRDRPPRVSVRSLPPSS